MTVSKTSYPERKLITKASRPQLVTKMTSDSQKKTIIKGVTPKGLVTKN
jgi:hypothetical protein